MKWLFWMLFCTSVCGCELTIEEKVGQLFIIPFDPSRDESHIDEVKEVIKKYSIGGVLTKATSIQPHRKVLKELQNASSSPLLVAIDAEWGVAMRIKECRGFPKNLTLGAHPKLPAFEIGQEIARQVRGLGAHLNLGPVVDVNTNPENPIIGMRSFGDDPLHVAQLATLVAQGIISEGILPVIKHFPGHGDVAIDSHDNRPICTMSLEQLKNSHLIPFYTVIKHAPCAIMTAHIDFPLIDDCLATFSKKLITDLLRTEWGFNGLVMTDALNMLSITLYHEAKEAALRAFEAGHDLLLYGSHEYEEIDHILRDIIPGAHRALVEAVKTGVISEERLDQSIQRIQKIKEKMRYDVLDIPLETTQTNQLIDQCYAQSMSAIGDLPSLEGQHILVVNLSAESFSLPFDQVGVHEIPESLDEYDIVIGLICDSQSKVQENCQIFDQLQVKNKLLIVMTNPYILREFHFTPAVICYENNPTTQQRLLSAIDQHWKGIYGKFPVAFISLFRPS